MRRSYYRYPIYRPMWGILFAIIFFWLIARPLMVPILFFALIWFLCSRAGCATRWHHYSAEHQSYEKRKRKNDEQDWDDDYDII